MNTSPDQHPGWGWPEVPADEAARLSSLHRLEILEGGREESLDRLARIARRAFNVPVALVNLIDKDHQVTKGAAGMSECNVPRNVSFCAHTILQDQAFVIEDTLLDPRFRGNPLVVGGEGGIRFYAGMPLRAPDGFRIGAFCLAGTGPRVFGAEDRELLAEFARQAEEEILAHRNRVELRKQLRLHEVQWQLSPNGILVVDEIGTPRHYNDRFLEFFRIPAEEARRLLVPGGFRAHLAAATRDAEAVMTAVRTFYESGMPRFDREIVLRDGRHLLCSSALIRDGDRRLGWTWTFVDVTDERLRSEELERARAGAESASVAKSQFLASMSHEMRTPLNAILGMSELLLGTRLKPEQREFAETIQTSGENLLSLISDLLELSRIEAQAVVLEEKTFDLSLLLEDVFAVASARSNPSAVELGYGIDPSLPLHWKGDSHRLGQVLLNLVGNALKFTESGEVSLRVEAIRDGDGNVARARFSVRDSGIGIAEKDLDKLFKAFSQVDQSATRRYGGTGLGLSISARLVKLLGGGAIDVSSTPGKGSTFSFDLPVRAAAVVPESPANAELSLSGRTVLIVDDNALNRQTLGWQTLRLGMASESVDGSAAALAALEVSRYDVLLLDYQMPDCDGLTLARRLRDNPRFASLPIVILTSYAELGEIEAVASPLGVRSLAKPVRQRALQEAILGVLRRPDGQEADAQSRRSSPISGLRILLAEDHPVNRKVAEAFFVQLGYPIETANDGAQAVEMAKQHPYDVVFMDVHMPEMDGHAATRALRKLTGDPNRPWIVAMTAAALTEEREACFASGMNDYLSKPVRLEDLRLALQRASQPAEDHVMESGRTPDPPNPDSHWRAPETDGEEIWKGMEIHLAEVTGGNDPETVHMLVQILLEDTPLHLASIDEAERAGDHPRLTKAVHSLRGSFGNMGAHALARLAGEIEDAYRRGLADEGAERLPRLREGWGQLRNVLERVLG